MFAQWDLLLGQVNWILELDYRFFQVDKMEQRLKVRLLNTVLLFLVRLISHKDWETQVQLVSYIVKFLNKQNLRNKLLDIFKAKVGGTPHRERIYKTRAFCKHVADGSAVNLSHEILNIRKRCQYNEYCFHEHLVPFD